MARSPPGRILSVAGRFPLFETAAAHKVVERGGKVGTVILEPQRLVSAVPMRAGR